MLLSGTALQTPGILCLLFSETLNTHYDNMFPPAHQKHKFHEFVYISPVSPVLRQTLDVIHVRFTLFLCPLPGSIHLHSLYSKEDFVLMLCFPLRRQSFMKSCITASDAPKIPARRMQMVTTATHTLSFCPYTNLKGKILQQRNEAIFMSAKSKLLKGTRMLPPTHPGSDLRGVSSNRTASDQRTQINSQTMKATLTFPRVTNDFTSQGTTVV